MGQCFVPSFLLSLNHSTLGSFYSHSPSTPSHVSSSPFSVCPSSFMIFLIWYTLNTEFVLVTFPIGRKSWGKKTDGRGGCALLGAEAQRAAPGATGAE